MQTQECPGMLRDSQLVVWYSQPHDICRWGMSWSLLCRWQCQEPIPCLVCHILTYFGLYGMVHIDVSFHHAVCKIPLHSHLGSCSPHQHYQHVECRWEVLSAVCGYIAAQYVMRALHQQVFYAGWIEHDMHNQNVCSAPKYDSQIWPWIQQNPYYLDSKGRIWWEIPTLCRTKQTSVFENCGLLSVLSSSGIPFHAKISYKREMILVKLHCPHMMHHVKGIML